MRIQNLSEGSETFTCNSFLVQNGETSLVDPGQAPKIVERLRDHGGPLNHLYVTHGHGDHVANLEAILEEFEPEVHRHGKNLEDGDTVEIGGEEFDVLHLPGHRRDHVAYLSRDSVFTGDNVVYSDSAYDDGSFGRTDIAGADRETLIESLRRLLDEVERREVSTMYPGHGPVFEGDVASVVERALERAEEREPKYDD